jgi:hypothetical protein
VPVLPNCIALVLCDRTVHHPDTGKVDLLGAFWEIRMPSFPAKTGPFTAWVALVNGAGRVPMRLEFELLLPDRLEVEHVTEIRFTMEFSDPRVVRVYKGRVHGLDLVSPGQCRVTLIAADTTLVQSYFMALKAGPPS